MRRIVATAIATLVALVVVPTAPAHAATVVIDSLSEIQAPYLTVTTSCADVHRPEPVVSLVDGPATPPLGTGSLRLETPSSDRFTSIARDIPQLSQLARFSLRVHDPDSRTSAVIRVEVPNPPFAPTIWTGSTSLPGGSGWTAVTDLMTRQWSWSTNAPDTPPELATIASFASRRDGAARVMVRRSRCSFLGANTAPTHVDALTIDLASEPITTLDFEAPSVAISIGATPGSISRGGSSTISGNVSLDGAPISGAVLTLEQSADGQSFTDLRSVEADASGNAATLVAPFATTWYRWRYAGLDGRTGTSSRVQLIVKKVPFLTSSVSRTSITKGESVTVGGALTADGVPLSGQPVALRSSVDGGTTWTEVTTVTSAADGGLSATVSPTTSTRYRWEYAGSAFYEPTISGSRFVTVMLVSALTATITPTIVDHDATAVVAGVIGIDGTPAAGVAVDLWTITGTATRLATVTSGADGSVSQVVTGRETRQYQWRYVGSPTTRGTVSPTVTLTVRRPTSLSMTASPLVLQPTEPTTISTVLRSDGNPQAGRTVYLERSTDGGASWTRLAVLTTDANGAASYTTSPRTTASYRWRHDRSPTLSPSLSPTSTVTVLYPTTLTIDAADDAIPPGGTTTLSTRLLSSNNGVPLLGETVTLKAWPEGAVDWTTVGNVVTDLEGNAALDVSPTVETRYKWRFETTATHRGSQSPTTYVTIVEPVVPTALAIEVIDDDLWAGQATLVGATLTADGTPKVNREITLSASSDGGTTWTPIATRYTDRNGQASLRISPSRTATYRWHFGGAPLLEPSTSPERTIVVRPLRVSALAINADATVINAGGTARIGAVLTGDGSPMAGAPVTLWRSAAGRNTWNVVATVETGADGRALVTVPQQVNMDYRWTYAGSESFTRTASTPLRVVARFVVTMDVVISPPHAGDRLLVRGTVSRYTASPVKLIRSTPLGGIAFAQAAVRSDGTYQIAVTIESAGTFSFYAQVLGDDANTAGRSPSRTITVPP